MKPKARAKLLIIVLAPLAVLIISSIGTIVPADDREGLDSKGKAFDLHVALKSPDVSRPVSNRVIDCSTNKTYRRGKYADFIASVGHKNIASDCRSCHKAARPTVGVGDRPTTRFASFALANYTNEKQKYFLSAGPKGEWTEISLDPNKLKSYSWKYDNRNTRQSPAFWIRFGGKTYRLVPLATPNENIGAMYYFEPDAGAKTARFSSARQPLRRGRR